ncbi:hypothetical protein K450DRAFT_276679 [Umbelopsis ramanniana AG]|uniref:Methyltransferase domain-containing protein n=1 Tax=Umbelopsis ramanniana AG TaxID=1314678 RepID=A0AAD5HIR9_UMBRA|nr:uncharacterized protein K450DRAFT_276679 [Umbelopsis ramanniana AG]KAI8584324.1 hypothetical protein K450DRAFT_276679 [Umbelopsis ramanniana AG]
MPFGHFNKKKNASKASVCSSIRSRQNSNVTFDGRLQSSKLTTSISKSDVTAASDLDSDPKEKGDQFYNYHGRAFLPEVDGKQYLLPCDDEEVERMEVHELALWHVFRKSLFAPVADDLEEGIRVLEVGIGTGKWITDLAFNHPKSQFIGTDIYIYPTTDLPINCQFKPVDTTEGLPFPDNSFDYVVQRNALYNYTRKEWENIVIPEMIRVLKPGGWIEFVEGETTIQDAGPKMSTWLMRLNVTLQSRTIHTRVGRQLGHCLQSNPALQNVEASFRSVPLGWLGKVGDIALEAHRRLFDSLRPRMCDDWDMEPFKYDLLTKSAITECKEFRSWSNYYYAIAQKSGDGNVTVPVIVVEPTVHQDEDEPYF